MIIVISDVSSKQDGPYWSLFTSHEPECPAGSSHYASYYNIHLTYRYRFNIQGASECTTIASTSLVILYVIVCVCVCVKYCESETSKHYLCAMTFRIT